LGKFLNGYRIQRAALTTLPGRKIIAKTWAYLYADTVDLLDYRFEDRIAEEKAFWLALAMRARIVHVLYGARAQAARFSWEQVAAQITAGYRRLLAGRNFASEPKSDLPRISAGAELQYRNPHDEEKVF
jgi:hypothetical protein